MSKKYNFSSVCNKCGVVANFMSSDPYKLPSYLAGIPNKWPGATEHLIDGNRCTCLQLEQLKAKLPRTADGVMFTPDMKLFYHTDGCNIRSTGVCHLYANVREPSLNVVEFAFGARQFHIPIIQCYSTKETLKAARGGK